MVFKKSYLFLLFILLISCKEEKLNQPIIQGENAFKLIEDKVGATEIVVVYNKGINFIQAYPKVNKVGDALRLSLSDNGGSLLLMDEDSVEYDVFGNATGLGDEFSLQTILNYKVYWFAASSFFPGIALYNAPSKEIGELGLESDPDWLIPTTNIYVGSSRDGLQSIDAPSFKEKSLPSFEASDEPDDNKLVLGLLLSNKPFAVPYSIMNWHEIVNAFQIDANTVITYCPLTGSSLVFKSDTEKQDFGVSGLLYNNNLIMYSRGADENLWQQMTLTCVFGPKKGEQLPFINSVELTYGEWKKLYPDTGYLSEETGQVRDYDEDPYPGYSAEDYLIYYPIDYQDGRLNAKQKVLLVQAGGEVKAYSIALLE